jgi:hypothetical protein
MGRTAAALPAARAAVGALGALAALAAACAGDGGAKQVGKLGLGTFAYVCTSGADAACEANADVPLADPSTRLPPVAAGATFDVTYTTRAGGADAAPDGHVDAVGTAFVGPDATMTHLAATRAGFAVLYGVAGDVPAGCREVTCDGVAPEDLVHVLVEPADHLELAHAPAMGGDFVGETTMPGGGAVSLARGGPTPAELFRAVLVTKDRRLLAGSLPTAWTSSDTSVARIASDAARSVIRLELDAPGTTTLTVTAGGLSASVTVTVT